MNEVAERIVEAMNRKSWSRAALATSLNISEGYVGRILEGKVTVSPYLALRLEQEIGLDPYRLLVAQVNEELARARAEFGPLWARRRQ